MSSPDPGGVFVLRDARAGDLQAFGLLVRQYQAEVFALALRFTGEHAAAVQLAQDVFVDLHTAIARIANHSHLRHWLLRAVSQRAMELHSQQASDPDSGSTDPGPGPEFTDRVMAHVELRWSHRRADFASGASRQKQLWHNRRGLIVGVAAVIAIAALLALWNSGKLQGPATAPLPTEIIAANQTPQIVAPARTNDAATRGLPLAARSAASQDAYPRYTVIVLPLRQSSLDAASLAPAEAFHAALLDELRKVPGVVLLIPGVTAPPETLRSADYLLTVTSLEAQVLPSGGTSFRIADSPGGRSLSAASPASGRQWPVEIRIQPIAQTSAASFTSTLQIGEDPASLPMLAAKQMYLLRLRIFPDLQVKQQLIARIRDTSLSAAERNTALDDLLGAQRDRGPGLSSIDISVITAGAAAMTSDERARLWRSLRGVPNMDLVDTLADSLRRDPDTNVRFEALATLAADYGTDARVRSIIETVSREDPATVMRMAARRARNGDAEWRKYLISALKDTSLPLPERLAPLLLAGQSATTPAETLGMRAIMGDEEIVNLLAGVIRDNWFDYTQAQTIGDALDLLTGAGIPAASDLLVEIPPDNSRPVAAVAAAAALPATQISPAAMSWLMKNRNNPRARRILDDLARGRADPQAGFMIEQMMQQRPPPRRPN